MIKAIIFDLDGVLIDTKELHFDSLNFALKKFNYQISREEHLSIYDGLSTLQKLEILSKSKGLKKSLHKEIYDVKQKETLKGLSKFNNSQKIKEIISNLKNKGYKIAICSNSIRDFLNKCIELLDIKCLVDMSLSNEDVKNKKPDSEIYLNCFKLLSISPKEALIIEDNPIGRRAAYLSGGNVLYVNNSSELNKADIFEKITQIEKDELEWVDKKINVLIPMAGEGSRFKEKGYKLPKPLINVNGQPMIKRVIDSLHLNANYIFLVRKEHIEEYKINDILKSFIPDCKIVIVDKLTNGAACTSLLAENLIDKNPLLIVNSDQIIEWSSAKFYYSSANSEVDGQILVFNASDSKWSYISVDNSGLISEVAEKKVISNIATVGIYFWKTGLDYVKYAKQMICKNIRTNGEFYIAPVFNEAIQDGKKFLPCFVDKMDGVGTPEDLENYLKNDINFT